MATLGEVMSRDVITIEPFDTIGHAAEKMVAEGVSAIVVSDGGRLLGIVTERDLTRAEGLPGRPHAHPVVGTFAVAAIESDGSELTSVPLGAKFPHGMLVAMSNGKVFHYYSWDDIAKSAGLK